MRLTKILFISFILSVFIAIIIISKNSSPHNLLIFSVDTLRTDHMSIYGYKKKTTPNIEKWAGDGVIFTNVRTSVPMTHPSLASIMTGKNPLNTRILSNMGLQLSKNTQTLARILKKYEFETAAYVTNGFGIGEGFNSFNTFIYEDYYYDKDGQELFKQGSRREYESFMSNAINWIQKNSNNRFFLWIHLMDPHAPYYPKEDLRCKFNEKYCSFTEKTIEEIEEYRARYQMCQSEAVPEQVVEIMEALYDGEIAYSDSLIGNVHKKIQELSLDKNTIVVILGDHGEGFDHNYFFNHREVLYDSSIKIPLIIRYPIKKFNETKISNTLVESIDILPTILSLLNIKHEDLNLEGINFSDDISPSLLFNKFINKKREFSYSVNTRLTKFSITDGEYKYIFSLPQTCLFNNQLEELYNLQKDGGEEKNLISTERKTAQYLKTKLFEYLSNYNLPLDIPNNFQNKSAKESYQDSQDLLDNLKSLNY